jgi:hypothetical protein
LNRHQLTSTTCRALEKAADILKFDDSSLCQDIVENSKHTSKDAFTQSENCASISDDDDDDDDMTEVDESVRLPSLNGVKQQNPFRIPKSSKDDTSINSLPMIKKHNRFGAPNSEDEDSNFSLGNFKNRRNKHRIHRVKIHKLKKSHRVNTAPNPRSNLFSQYGCPALLPYIRKLNTTKNFANFRK